MKPHQYLAIGVRLFSIVLFIYGLRQSSYLIQVLINGSVGDIKASALFISATVAIPLIISGLLWVFPLTISKAIITPEMDLEIKPLDTQSTLTVFILAIGLLVLFYAAVDSVFWATLWHMHSENMYAQVTFSLTEENKSNIVATIVELVMATLLLFKAKTISFYLLRITK